MTTASAWTSPRRAAAADQFGAADLGLFWLSTKSTVSDGRLRNLARRLSPDNPLVAARVLWSYLHGAVSLRLAWPTREGLDPEEAFMAGIAAFESCIVEGVSNSNQALTSVPAANAKTPDVAS